MAFEETFFPGLNLGVSSSVLLKIVISCTGTVDLRACVVTDWRGGDDVGDSGPRGGGGGGTVGVQGAASGGGGDTARGPRVVLGAHAYLGQCCRLAARGAGTPGRAQAASPWLSQDLLLHLTQPSQR